MVNFPTPTFRLWDEAGAVFTSAWIFNRAIYINDGIIYNRAGMPQHRSARRRRCLKPFVSYGVVNLHLIGRTGFSEPPNHIYVAVSIHTGHYVEHRHRHLRAAV